MSRARDLANLGDGVSASDITTGTFSTSVIPDLAGDKITSGTLGNTVQDNITRLGTVTQGSIGSAVTGYTGAKMVDFWKVDSNQGAADQTILNDFSRVSRGSEVIGSGMTKHATSGVFTFPDTGKYIIHQFITLKQTASGGEAFAGLVLQVTLNNTNSWDDYAVAYDSGPNTNYYGQPSSFYFLDVTDTANVKCRFKRRTTNTSVEIIGHSADVFSGMLFIRIGDT